ncbi:hypothetical protein [Marinospirillum insulare]|uniref:Uncharacterized protein n=1 Tax=Marinospirillum insulare TaxID=217169 RepID=A0ABQ6A1I0_9GAMM|nr:hypothetical protein [Marinospirillum insulare]GLR64771.1 hypothetical protein GCM10007878_22090 [Marinospirillum insulare]
MLVPTIDNTSGTPLNRQKKAATSELMPTSSMKTAANESPTKQLTASSTPEKIDDKTPKQEKEPKPLEEKPLQELPESTFSTEANSRYPDYTVELKSSSGTTSAPMLDPKPDEIRYGRKRPSLPMTFSFGLRRPQAVAVAMRHPLLEGKQPTTAAQAILDTLDLAATNRLPYIKGTEVSLVA